MGLDKRFSAWFNDNVKVKALLQALGLGLLWGRDKVSRTSPLVRERERFEEEVREQFKKLKEKGLSIPVFTL